ncbi:Hpt domain-containing protein [Serratia marcescens]|nr:sensor histidine kinase [Serratia marcescens]WGL90131.1 Hpt domain-containing protein [Serratia marcescens]
MAIDHFLTKPISLAAIGQVLAQQPQVQEEKLVLTDLRQTLAEMAGGDRAMMQRLAQTLSDTLRQDRQRLADAVAASDWPRLEQAAHRIKGSLLMLQLPEAAQLCQQLVETARRGELAAAAYTKLKALVAQIEPELDALLAAAPTFAMHKDE